MARNILKKRGHGSSKSSDKTPTSSPAPTHASEPRNQPSKPISTTDSPTVKSPALKENNGTGTGIVARHALGTLTRSATIRSVPSFEGSDTSPDSKRSELSSSLDSTTSPSPSLTPRNTDHSSLPNPPPPPQTVRLKFPSTYDTPSRSNGTVMKETEAQQDSSILTDGAESNSGQWDSTIGKAGLGKTGRVINKLVSDNDALKRDIQIERLRAEEAKQAARLVEDKMERMVSDYESRLLEANVTKTLLARKERQVETLTATVEQEKNKSRAAMESERTWKGQLDKVKTSSKAQVDEATNLAQLMEGRYNAISSHWKGQGDEVKRAMAKMRTEVASIVEDRRRDDEKIDTLRALCDQQDSNIAQLKKEKEDIAQKFAEYKQLQEHELLDLKTKGHLRDTEQEKLLRESKEALDKLRWALNVKKNVKGAQ